MSHVVTLPALGESVTEGTVTRWLKTVGEIVAVDEPLVEISTDKVDTEIPSPVAGFLLEISAGEEATVQVGSVLAVIGAQEAAAPAVPRAPAPVEAPAVSTPPAVPTPPVPTAVPIPGPTSPSASATVQRTSGSVAPASPQVVVVNSPVPMRRLPGAHEWSLGRRDGGWGPASVLPSSSGPAGTVPSLRSSAQLTTVVEVDLTSVDRLRMRAGAEVWACDDAGPDVTPFVAKAAIEALRAHPRLNAWFDADRDEVTLHDHEHLAVVVDSERGPVTPVVRNAGDLSVSGLAKKLSELADRARDGAIGAEEQSGATFTLTDLGSRGALFGTPIIVQPQAAILGVGAVGKRVVVVDDPRLGETIAIRKMAFLALTYDRRLVDGVDAGRFLTEVKGRLEAAQFDL